MNFFWTQTYTSILVGLVTAGVSLTAAAFSLIQSRRTNKRELFVKVYEELVEPERQRGREILYRWVEMEICAADAPPEEQSQANHAMAWFELTSYMAKRKHISQKDARAVWGRTAVRTYEAADLTGFIELRDRHHGQQIWPNYAWFYSDLQKRSKQDGTSQAELPAPSTQAPETTELAANSATLPTNYQP